MTAADARGWPDGAENGPETGHDEEGFSMLDICGPGLHRHVQTCARCGTTEGNVAVTVTADGNTWPPLCVDCATRVRRASKAERIAAVERVEALA